MDERHFIWDEVYEGIVSSGPTEAESKKKKVKKRKSEKIETKVYCPHKGLIFAFKESLSFAEQSKFRKLYQRKHASEMDVVLLQDVKDLALYSIASPMSLEFIGFAHLAVVDRFLRALILYLQHYLVTWTELGAKRAATAKRAANPLAGGARVERANEMKALRCLLARAYYDLLMGCVSQLKKYHHMAAGSMSFVQSKGEKDLRLFEGLIQLAHRVAWIALERQHKELIELEIHRLFRTDPFNTAKRKYADSGIDLEVPEDEHWILYGPKMPPCVKILQNSPLIYEILRTRCDHRILLLGLTNAKSSDPRIIYLENAFLAKEEDLPRLGIKVGILGLPRTDFDVILIPRASEDDQVIVDDADTEKIEGADDYETLIPPYGSDLELDKPFPVNKSSQYVNGHQICAKSRKKWMVREMSRAAMNYVETYSMATTPTDR
ncbi:protein phosphatase 1 regulatory subunit 36-like [Phymastichus coffea]|uniref:protein phosphatase 1 regulatory subunit 36-like n=1 Tax=Phymastichus coffea TaxID=108790 RepID=UPI00273B0240|nr:protein phosphatase 1 regulatory subunit 36-like [Phymastichus coffea]